MKLFEVIPEKFFLVFAGKNREIYAEALLLLYEQYHLYQFGVEYSVLRDLIQELIETREEDGTAYEVEENETVSFEEDLARVKANALLRRLEKLGWLQVETRDSFQQFVVLPHYTSRILGLLKELCVNRAVEYQRFAFVTYQLITGEEAARRPCFAILEAERMTEQFLDELKILINNMKHHMEQIATKDSLEAVLEHHFDEYKTKIIDQSYHRLKTSDHVSRYRQKILEQIQKWLLDRDWLEAAACDGLRSEFFATPEEAKEKVRGALLRLEEIYCGLDEIFYQIDLRHNQYLRSSFDRARYLSQHGQGVDQVLAGVLELTAASIEAKEPIELDLFRNLFQILELNLLEEASLYKPRKKRPPHQPEGTVAFEISEALREELRGKSLDKMQRVISREKVRHYVLGKLQDRTEMGIEELAPRNLEEFLYLIYVYLYGYEQAAGYSLQRDPENRLLLIGEYQFYYRRVVKTELAELQKR